jgi:hypothetical protein
MDGKLGENHSGELQRETAEQRADRIRADEPCAQLELQSTDPIQAAESVQMLWQVP